MDGGKKIYNITLKFIKKPDLYLRREQIFADLALVILRQALPIYLLFLKNIFLQKRKSLLLRVKHSILSINFSQLHCFFRPR